MKKTTLLVFITLLSVMIISCSKDDITDSDTNTAIEKAENDTKNRAKSGIYLQGITPVCDRLGPRIELHLEYIGSWTYNTLVYIDLYEADGITLIETYEVNNYYNVTNLYYTVGNGFNHKCCSLLDPDTEYLVRIRYGSTFEGNLQPVTTEPDCFCSLGDIEG